MAETIKWLRAQILRDFGEKCFVIGSFCAWPPEICGVIQECGVCFIRFISTVSSREQDYLQVATNIILLRVFVIKISDIKGIKSRLKKESLPNKSVNQSNQVVS